MLLLFLSHPHFNDTSLRKRYMVPRCMPLSPLVHRPAFTGPGTSAPIPPKSLPDRPVQVLVGHKVTEVQESLEETQMILNAMNAQRQSAPFKDRE